MDLPLDHLTDAQQRVVDHATGIVRVRGRAGTGKTTALAGRYLMLLERERGARVVVVSASARAADRLRSMVIGRLRGGFTELAITTWPGLAGELVRSQGTTQVLGRVEQRDLIVELLAAEPGAWPTCASALGLDAFVDEVASAVRHLQSVPFERDVLLARAIATGVGERWRELLAFFDRYLSALAGLGAVDTTGMLARATEVARSGGVTYDHVLVDDHERATPLVAAFAHALFAPAASVAVAANPDASFESHVAAGPDHFGAIVPALDVTLDHPFREPARPVLIQCAHPALEGDTIAGELLATHNAGQSWQDTAVIVRGRGHQFDAVVRGLARHGIPHSAPTAATPRPVVQAVADLLRWVAGDAGAFERVLVSPLSGLDAITLRRVRREAVDQGVAVEDHPALAPLVAHRDHLAQLLPPVRTPAGVAFAAWERVVAPLFADAIEGAATADAASIEGVSAFIATLDDVYDGEPGIALIDALARVEALGPRRAARRVHDVDAVTVTTAEGAVGREWRTVVVAGAVEGAFPSVRSHTRYFDRQLVGEEAVKTVAERRAQSLADERRLFAEIVLSRASDQVLAVAAHQPGVLVSRFVERWSIRGPRLPIPPSAVPLRRSPPPSPPMVHPARALRLSASQLDTYEDCPLRYAYQYVAGVRGDGSVSSELGTLVHGVLADFLDPGASHTRDSKTLREFAERHWRDDIARFRPQVEEARRSYFEMLDGWWEAEGSSAPEVLAVEHPFEIAVGPHTVVGQIDRIDRAPGGVRIIDFKTGKREPAEKEMPDNLQLAVYHLAATRDPVVAAWGLPVQLDLIFVRSMNVRSQPITADHATSTEARILAFADRILAEDFAPSVAANCRYCDFHRLCPLQLEGREVGVA